MMRLTKHLKFALGSTILLTCICICIWIWMQSGRVPPDTGLGSDHGPRSIEPLTSGGPTTSADTVPQTAGGANPESPSLPYVIKAGGISVSVVFEDQEASSLSEHHRAEIIRDFQTIYGHLPQYETYGIKPRIVKLNGNDVSVSRGLQFVGPGRHFPDSHLDTFGLLIDDTEELEMIVGEDLMLVYQKAFDFKERYAKEFEEFEDFFSAFNLDTSQTMSGKLPSEVIFLHSSFPNTPETIEGIFSQIKSNKFRRPSLLDFYENDSGSRLGSNELPEGALVTTSMLLDSNNIPVMEQPLVYVDKKWKFAFFPPGT